MANTNDPKKPKNPDQPEGNDTPQTDSNTGYTHGNSSFEFQLPDEVGSFSELPPIPQPDANDTSSRPELPPVPDASRPVRGTFDFINVPGSRGSFGDFGLEPVPIAPEAIPPIDDAMTLPELPELPNAGDSAVTFDPPVLNTDLASLTLGAEHIDPATLPDIASLFPNAGPASDVLPEIPPIPGTPDSAIDLQTLEELPTGNSSFKLGEDDLLPLADPASSFTLGTGKAEPSSGSIPDVATLIATTPPPQGPGSSFTLGTGVTPPSSGSVPDVTTLKAATPDFTPAIPLAQPASSGSTPSIPVAQPASSGSTPLLPNTPPVNAGASSYEFELPDNVKSFSELPPIPQPDANDTSSRPELPPVPDASRPVRGTFDFINVPGSRSSFGDFGLDPVPAEAVEPVAPQTPATPLNDPEAVIGNLEPVEPVAPASGWLDSAVISKTPTAPSSKIPSAIPDAELTAASDIFSGIPAKPAMNVESSDVISATSSNFELPIEPALASDVAINFEAPAGGSTLADSDIQELEILDSGVSLVSGPKTDEESIHDMDNVVSENPLFDSAQLVDAPELPATNPFADSPDYGASILPAADASSILADLNEPSNASGNSSAVRIEAPGLDRTLTGDAAQNFDLTIADEPIPAELLEGTAEVSPSEVTNWEDQSGSDLFAERRTAPEIDMTGMVEPVDVDLTADDPSLSSAPESIFSDTKLKGSSSRSDSGQSSDGGSVRIGQAEPRKPVEDVADAAEFSDHPVTPKTVSKGDDAKKKTPLSSADFELPSAVFKSPKGAVQPPPPEEPEVVNADEAIDWDAVSEVESESPTRGIPRDADIAALLAGELADDSAEIPTRTAKPLEATGAMTPDVSVDWEAGSAEGSALSVPVKTTKPTAKPTTASRESTMEAKTKVAAPNKLTSGADAKADKPAKPEKAKPEKKRGGGMLPGVLLGALAAGGAWAGLYFSGTIPNAEPRTSQAPPPGMNPGGPPGPPGAPPGFPQGPPMIDPAAAFANGDTAKALDYFKNNPPANTADKALAGHIRVFAKAQGIGTDADLKDARKQLEDVLADADARKDAEGTKRAVKAAVALGVSHEIAGDNAAARKVYTDAIKTFPAHATTFETLIEKLNAFEPNAGGTSQRLAPADAERLLFAISFLLQDGPKGDDVEPGVFYWKAVNLAASGKYTEAVEQITKAKAAHVARAKAIAGRGVNPLSDPLEQIFPRSCDDLKAYWELRGAVYGNPAIAAAIKKDGLQKTIEALAKAEKDVTTAREMAKKLEGDLAKLTTDAKATEKAKLDAEAKLKKALEDVQTAEAKLVTANEDLKLANANLKVAEKDAKEQKDALAALANELKAAATVPEKWMPADLLAATKSIVSRATGPDLKALVPNAMIAVGGGGLATSQFIEIADRLNKAEAAAKAATDKLAIATKQFTDKYDADTKKLKDDHAAELKKLNDGYAVDTKKLKDDHAEAVKKLKDGNTDELKKLTDKYLADSKKLTDDHATAVAKLKEAHTTALTAEQAKTDAAIKRAAMREIEFQKQLANAVTPTQVMDLWLPTLTDLRRATDSAPALAAASKALNASQPDSEDAAKARTVAGMAYLIQGDLANAKEAFQAAQRNPAYKTATGKMWVKVVDDGLEAITDPSAPYRQPVVVPPVNLKLAAKSLDLGITAYKAGRYEDAAKALTEAAKHNPADPIAWYFLGATRWAQGNKEQAQKDFAQGGEREKLAPLPQRILSEALTPIQGATRDALDTARP